MKSELQYDKPARPGGPRPEPQPEVVEATSQRRICLGGGGGGGHGRSGGNASAGSWEVPLALASLWAKNLDAQSTTVNVQSTYSQRTVNAQSTYNETCLTVPGSGTLAYSKVSL